MVTAHALPPSPGRSRRLAARYCELLGLTSIVLEASFPSDLVKPWISAELELKARANIERRHHWFWSQRDAESVRFGMLELCNGLRRPRDLLAMSLDQAERLLLEAAAAFGKAPTPHASVVADVRGFVVRFEGMVERQFLMKITAQYKQHRDSMLAGGGKHPSWSRFFRG